MSAYHNERPGPGRRGMHCSLHGREIMGLDRWLSGRGIRVFLFLFLFFKYGELKVEKWIGSGFVWFMAVLMESAFFLWCC